MHLLVAEQLDYESKKILKIRVRTTDNYGKYIEKMFQIQTINVNEPPKDIIFYQFDIPKDAKKGTVVGIFEGIDPEDSARRR